MAYDPFQWAKDLQRAVPDSVVKDLVSDFRRGPPPPGNQVSTVRVMGAGTVIDGDTAPKHRGWVETPALPQNPPGWREVEQLLDAEDRQWKADRQRQAELARLRAEAERKEIAELQEKLNSAPKVQK
jgi:hypothetical protein